MCLIEIKSYYLCQLLCLKTLKKPKTQLGCKVVRVVLKTLVSQRIDRQ